jgi:diaminohydroxyphosphoribosylaminopyrimidine deaminase/5-amino-6-(5-phosphoribosylamino)uracil reductase
VNRVWNHAVELGRPVVVWKVAASLDGRIAAADGSSKWITSPESREQSHQLRAEVDAVLTGTGTAVADRPALTARPGGVGAPDQPLRAVMGRTQLPADHPLAEAMTLATRDPHEAMARLWQADVRRVMLECGPRLAGAFLEADVVDEVVWFAAPLLLGSHGLAVAAGGPPTLTDASRWQVVSLGRSGPDVRIDLRRKEM